MILAIFVAVTCLAVSVGVVLVAAHRGRDAGARDAHAELRRAEEAERAWHVAHPDPTAPALPDYSAYLGRLAEAIEAP